MTSARWFGRSTVITPHHLASGVGGEILAAGGNAVDAIVAANLALGVVAPYYCGVGGDLLAMVWDGGVHGYRSVGRSPAHATSDHVRDLNGGADLMLPFGAASVSVPGAVRGWFDLLERWGTMSFADLSAPAVRLAVDGFPLSRPGAFRVAGSAALCDAFVDDTEALMAVFGGVSEGDLLRQPALAGTLDLLGRDGPDAYYRGPIAASIAAELQRRGWPMTLEDLAGHEPAWVDPIFGRFGDLDVAELPPPTQGVTALQMLAIAEGLDLGSDDVDRLHLLIEVAKIGLAERDIHVGDPDHMTLRPADLLDPQRIERLRAEIDPATATSIAKRPQPDGGTAYLCAADRDGLAVSLIQSNFTAIGSGVHVAEWGINLHNRGSAFTLEESSPNGFAGGKLPMHTLIPALGLRDGRLALVFGTMGGHAQAPIHLQLLTRLVHDRVDAQAAIDAPRFETDPSSGRVGIEARVDPAWTSALASRGHDVNLLRAYDDGVGHADAIEIHPNGFRVERTPVRSQPPRGTESDLDGDGLDVGDRHVGQARDPGRRVAAEPLRDPRRQRRHDDLVVVAGSLATQDGVDRVDGVVVADLAVGGDPLRRVADQDLVETMLGGDPDAAFLPRHPVPMEQRYDEMEDRGPPVHPLAKGLQQLRRVQRLMGDDEVATHPTPPCFGLT